LLGNVGHAILLKKLCLLIHGLPDTDLCHWPGYVLFYSSNIVCGDTQNVSSMCGCFNTCTYKFAIESEADILSNLNLRLQNIHLVMWSNSIPMHSRQKTVSRSDINLFSAIEWVLQGRRQPTLVEGVRQDNVFAKNRGAHIDNGMYVCTLKDLRNVHEQSRA